MNFLNYILATAVGGAIGAMLRYSLSSTLDKNKFDLPFGTFLANMLASFMLGVFMALAKAEPTSETFVYFTQGGFCATLSTFSSLAFQIATMLREKRYEEAFAYTLSTFLLGMLLFSLALKIF